MYNVFSRIELKVSFFVVALILQAEATGATKAATVKSKKEKGATETELLLLKQQSELNQRLDVLNAKLVQLEKEKRNLALLNSKEKSASKGAKGLQFASLDRHSTVKTDAVPIQPVVTKVRKPVQYKTVKYIVPSSQMKEEKGSSRSYKYIDKNYYNISPTELNSSKYFQILNQNEPLSTAYNNLCIKNALCFSALANFDFRYYDRSGGVESVGQQAIPSLIGVGVRPMFGPTDNNVIGSINNANLFIDGYVNPYVTAHMNLAYVNGSVKGRTFSHNDSDWASVYRNAAAVKMDEVYATLVIPKSPFFVRIGRQYLNFGDYKPYPITESLVQLLTQMRSGAIIGGFVLPNGLYASVNYSMAQQSLENLSSPFSPAVSVSNRDRNFGGKIGYEGNINALAFNVNASFIHDLRDSDYLNENAYLWSFNLARSDYVLVRGGPANQAFVMHRSPGIAAHADLQWKQFGILAEFATALNSMNSLNPVSLFNSVPINPMIQTRPPSRIHAWGVHGNVAFEVFGCPSQADVGYERGYESQVYQTVVYGPLPNCPFCPEPFNLGNVLPSSRIIGTVNVAVMPEIILSAQWVHDKDFPPQKLGTNRSSNIGILRISTQL